MPLVSIIIPTYQRKELVTRAISSVLRQTYKEIETIVVDDGSTDGTREVLDKIPLIRTIFIEHRGASAARNAGVRAAKGEFVAFLDSDDEWDERKIEVQLDAMIRQGAGVSLAGAMAVRDGRRSRVRVKTGWLTRKDIFRVSRPISASALMITRGILKETSFDESLLSANDLDFLLRVSKAERILSLAETTVCIHKSDKRPRLSNDYRRKRTSYIRVMERLVKGKYKLGSFESLEFLIRLCVFIVGLLLAGAFFKKLHS